LHSPRCVAWQSSQATFASAEEASHALFLAVRNHDEPAVTEILQAGNSPVSADEQLQARLDRERFVQKYQEMHRLVREAHGGMVLYIGAENWPFPIPLVSRNGAWRFDPDAGVPEIRYRRIGENELAGSGHRLAAIAYPAAYRSSGVMTFIVDADGAYQKDLGPKTVKIAGTMVEYRIDRTWTATEATL
jgi:hypothetical protein